jgi:hypothetical protein
MTGTARVQVMVVAALLAVVGCASDPGNGGDSGSALRSDSQAIIDIPTATPHSGTRIKLSCIDSDDGARLCQGFRDSQLNTACSWVPFADGTLRCAPLPAHYQNGSEFFSNATCTGPRLVQVDSADGCQAPTYDVVQVVSTAAACGPAAYAVYHLGQKYTGALYHSVGSGCGLATASSSMRFYELGERYPDATFQAGRMAVAE